MKNRKFYNIVTIVLIIAVLTVSLSGCMMVGRGNINEFADDLFVSLFGNDALSANFFFENPTEFGIDAKATLYTPSTKQEYENNHYAMRTQALLMAAMFKYSKMDASDKELFDFIQGFFINQSKFQDYYYFQDNYIGRYMGTQANLPIYLTEYKFRTAKDIDDYLSLCEQAETAFPKYIEYEKERINNGYGRAVFVLQGALEQCESFSGVSIKDIDTSTIDKYNIPAEENFVLTNFKNKVNACDYLSAEEKNAYIAKATVAINRKLIPSYIQLGIDLENIIKNTPPDKFNNEGLAKYKNGKDYYQVLFNDSTGTSDSVNEAYIKLYNAFASTSNELAEILSQIYEIKGNDFKVDTAIDEMFASDNWQESALYDTINNLKSAMNNNFPAMPETTGKVVLKQVDPSLAEHYSPAAFFVSALDNPNADEVIIINSSRNNTGYLSFDLLAHEGIPGHLYQYNYVKHSNLNNVVKVLSPTSYKEGWATYVQHYMADYYKPDTLDNLLYKARLLDTLRYSYLRCMVDIWVNYDGLSLSQVITKVADLFNIEESDIINDSEFYNLIIGFYCFCIEVPANAMTYFYSYLNITKVKSALKAKGYNDMQIHTAILNAPYNFDMICAKYGITI